MRNEGVIKFRCLQQKEQPEFPESVLSDLNLWRERLLHLGFIGINPDGVGYGNISVRYKSGFIISGSGTGGIQHLDATRYAFVTQWDINTNTVTCIGLVPASSESLSHAAAYVAGGSSVSAVIHVHHPELWQILLKKHLSHSLDSVDIIHNSENTIPSTPADAEYGTPFMAKAISHIVSDPGLSKNQILVMQGHEEGILVWGKDLNEAGNTLLRWARLILK